MLKKTIQFEDLDGNVLVEDFYFNLRQAEIAEMELSTRGGLVEHLRNIVKAEDGAAIIQNFKAILTKSVGKRSEDGRSFIKSQEIVDDFLHSDAYSVLFMELVTDADKASEFINGIVPASLLEKVDMTEAESKVIPELVPSPPVQKSLSEMTDEELTAHLKSKHPKDMSLEELQAGMRLKLKS